MIGNGPKIKEVGTLVPRQYKAQALAMLPYVDQALAKFGRAPVYREFVLTQTEEGAVIFFVVLEDRQLPDPIHLYENEKLLGEISTALRGRPVAYSNHTGFRYAILLNRLPPIPEKVPFPNFLENDVFAIGIGHKGEIKIPAGQFHNAIICGASQSGKSTHLTQLAYTAALNGYQLFLADPQLNTFSKVWENVAAAPIAGPDNLSDLLQQVNDLAAHRMEAFERVTRPSGLPVQNFREYNQVAEEKMKRAFLIIDEANNYTEDPELRDHLALIARTTLKAGIHTIVAAHSWRAADVPKRFSDQFGTRICFRTANPSSAQVIFDDPRWGQRMTKVTTKGRGVIRSQETQLDMMFFQGFQVSETDLASLLLSNRNRVREDRPADAPVLTPPARRKLSDLEHKVIQLAQQDSNKVTQRSLIEWGVTDRPTEARKLLEGWRLRKLLVKDPNQNQAHVLTGLATQLYQQDFNNGFVKNES